jgi:hypothetical protein
MYPAHLPNGTHADWVNRLDPEARTGLRSYRHAIPTVADGTVPPEGRACVGLIVEYTGDDADLASIGFQQSSHVRHPKLGYVIVTGSIAIECLDELAQIPHVVQVEGPRRMFPD